MVRITITGLRQFAYSREFYQPQYYPNQANETRNDFRSTVFWNTRIDTDNKGEAEVKFFILQAISNFRITIEGISSTGIPGHGEGTYFVQKPLSIAVKTPASVIHGDTLALQVVVTNNSPNPVNGVLNLEAPAASFLLLSDSKVLQFVAAEYDGKLYRSVQNCSPHTGSKPV